MRRSSILLILDWVCCLSESHPSLLQFCDFGCITLLDILISSATLSYDSNFLTFVDSASKWKDSSSGQHVEYDQRPDIFRFVDVYEC